MDLVEIAKIIFDLIGILLSLLLIPLLVSFTLSGIRNLLGGEDYLPFVPTPVGMIDKMIEFGGIKDGNKVIDLGSGSGSIVLRIASRLRSSVVGVELDHILVIYSRIRSLFIPKKGKAKFIRGDMLKQDLSKYDFVMLFITHTFMQKFLKNKFERELKRGAKVVSYSFSLDSGKFEEEIFITGRKGLGDKIFVYTKK